VADSGDKCKSPDYLFKLNLEAFEEITHEKTALYPMPASWEDKAFDAFSRLKSVVSRICCVANRDPICLSSFISPNPEFSSLLSLPK
jgi:hypothetical protein